MSNIYIRNVHYVLRKQLDSTTVQSQFFMEANEFILDVFRTGAVLSRREGQQDVDLQDTEEEGTRRRRTRRRQKIQIKYTGERRTVEETEGIKYESPAEASHTNSEASSSHHVEYLSYNSKEPK